MSFGVNRLPFKSRDEVYIFPDNTTDMAANAYNTTNARIDCHNGTAEATAFTAAIVGLVNGKNSQKTTNGFSAFVTANSPI